MGELSHEGRATGALFGCLRDILGAMDLFETRRVVLCFDSRQSVRRDALPGYKSTRRNKRSQMTPEESADYEALVSQIDDLRLVHAPRAGFVNVLHADGFEADDMVGAAVRDIAAWGQSAVIVAGDHDMYQLLSDRVHMWSYKRGKLYGKQQLLEEYGVTPGQWRYVKAIAGCRSDDIPGVPRVADKTACKFLRGDLSETTAAYKSIVSMRPLWESNLALVTLPHPSTPEVHLRDDVPSEDGWNDVVRGLGMGSLVIGRRDTPRGVRAI